MEGQPNLTPTVLREQAARELELAMQTAKEAKATQRPKSPPSMPVAHPLPPTPALTRITSVKSKSDEEAENQEIEDPDKDLAIDIPDVTDERDMGEIVARECTEASMRKLSRRFGGKKSRLKLASAF